MNPSVNFRLAALGFAAGLMGVLIVVAIVLSQRTTDKLRTQLSTVDSESFGIADHFKDSLREVNNIRFRYTIDHDQEAWNQFLAASRQLDAWMDQQAPKLTTSHEKEALGQVKAAYDDSLAEARQSYLRN